MNPIEKETEMEDWDVSDRCKICLGIHENIDGCPSVPLTEAEERAKDNELRLLEEQFLCRFGKSTRPVDQ